MMVDSAVASPAVVTFFLSTMSTVAAPPPLPARGRVPADDSPPTRLTGVPDRSGSCESSPRRLKPPHTTALPQIFLSLAVTVPVAVAVAASMAAPVVCSEGSCTKFHKENGNEPNKGADVFLGEPPNPSPSPAPETLPSSKTTPSCPPLLHPLASGHCAVGGRTETGSLLSDPAPAPETDAFAPATHVVAGDCRSADGTADGVSGDDDAVETGGKIEAEGAALGREAVDEAA